jgi:hypothetical protein
MIALLALAHDQGVEADLAAAITIILENGELPDAALLRAQFVDRRAKGTPLAG